MKKIILSFLSLYIFVLTGWANEGNSIIKGKVITSDGASAADVTVIVKGTNKGAVTSSDGHFAIRNISAGSYELEISLQGYETVTQKITVGDNETGTLSIRLLISQKQLQEVIVRSDRRKFTRPSSDFVAKMPLKNMENPQVYSTITKDLLTEQMAFSVDDAVKNAPGLQKMWEATGRSGDGGAYYNARGFILQSQLRNGIAGNVTSKIDAVNLESIEVIKGPSATLFGSVLTSYGGLINRVTKKPHDRFGGELSYSNGSYGFNRMSADINTPVDAAGNLLFRINAAFQSEGSFQDNGFDKGYAIAPSISFKASDRLSFSFDAELFGGTNSSKQMVFFYFPTSELKATNPKELGIDYNRSYSSADIYQTSRSSNFFGQMKYTISDHWISQTNFSTTSSYSDGPYGYYYIVPNAVATGDADATGADYMQRADQSTSAATDRILEIQQNFIGDFHIGTWRNRLVAGLDYFTQNSNQLFYGADFDLIKKNGNIPEYGNFNRDNLNAVLQDPSRVWYYPYMFKTNTYSAYASDVLNIGKHLVAMAALRVDHYDNKGNFDKATGEYSGGYKQTSLSPKFGLVYQALSDQLSLFANYQNGFTNQTGVDVKGVPFKPEQANQVEGGVKVNAFKGRLTGTVSYYQIRVTDLVRPDVTNPNFSIQDGTQFSKGFEVEVIANPVSGLNIIAGFAYNDSKMERSDADVEGRRPATAMSPVSANLWLGYKLSFGNLRGLGFGFGGNYASENKIVNSVYYGVFTLPAYTVLGASVFYDQPKYRIGLKVDNLTNQQYWIGYTTMNAQKLRSLTGTISFKF